MASLGELVGSPPLRPALSWAARPREDPVVERVVLIEDLADLSRVPRRAIVLLSRTCSALTASYRFEVALRTAGDRGASALVISADDVGHLTPTAAAIAERSGTAVLATAAPDLAELAVAIAHELAGDAGAALLRAHAAIRAIAAHPEGTGPEALVAHAGGALGVPIRLEPERPVGTPSAPVIVDGAVEAWATAPGQEGDAALALDIVLHAAAQGASRTMHAARRAHELPIQSGEDALSELLTVPERGRAAIVQRARDLSIPVDGWHIAARLEAEDLAGTVLQRHERPQGLSRGALAKLRGDGGIWHGARSGAALVLVRMHRDDPGTAGAADVAGAMDAVIRHLLPRFTSVRLRCGVGSSHAGAAGLLATVSEAQAALAGARTGGHVNRAVPFDGLGLRRTLVEWYASETAQEAVASVLSPLAALGEAKSERLIETLHVYLDLQCSLSRTAERLNLHRNAVSYRIRQVFSMLDVERDNPDDLLLLQLACRARKLG